MFCTALQNRKIKHLAEISFSPLGINYIYIRILFNTLKFKHNLSSFANGLILHHESFNNSVEKVHMLIYLSSIITQELGIYDLNRLESVSETNQYYMSEMVTSTSKRLVLPVTSQALGPSHHDVSCTGTKYECSNSFKALATQLFMFFFHCQTDWNYIYFLFVSIFEKCPLRWSCLQ